MAVFHDTFWSLPDVSMKKSSEGEGADEVSAEVREIYTSDYVTDEAVTLMLRRAGKLELAIDVGEYILGSRIRKTVGVEGYLRSSLEKFQAHEPH